MDVDIAQLMCLRESLWQQVFVGVVFCDFGGESHHLSGRCMATHIGIAQIYIVFIDSHDAVHYLFHLGLLVPLRIAPFTVDDVFLGNLRTHLH